MKTGFIYKLVSKDINVTDCYVGSTGNTTVRKSKHKSDCNNVNRNCYNYPVYQHIRNNNGFANWDMIVLETVQYNEKYELKARERHHMETLGATLNTLTPGRTSAEYREDRKEHIGQKKKEYREDHKEHIGQKNKEYRKDNPEYDKQYRADNLEQINQKQNQKHVCECSGKYTNSNKAQHAKTIRHQKHLEQ